MSGSDDFRIVSDTPDWLLIDKSPDIGMHREGEIAGIVERVRQQTGWDDLFPVHRLDKMTSGLLLLGRSQASTAALSALFSERKVEKFYLALTDRKPERKQGWVRGDMLPARGGNWKLARTQHQPAITRFISRGLSDGLRLFLLRPHTGKTHQLRVALRSLGAPVIGDTRYYSGALRISLPDAVQTADRGYLHAWALRFPWQGGWCEFVSAPSRGLLFQREDLNACLETWLPPWQLDWPAVAGAHAPNMI